MIKQIDIYHVVNKWHVLSGNST